MLIALWDTEANGLLRETNDPDKKPATKVHCIGFKIGDTWWSCNDQPGWSDRGVRDVVLPSGKILKGVHHGTIAQGLIELAKADLRVAHNGQDYDERLMRRFYPWWKPKGDCLDTLILSRLLFPTIHRDGPNTHKVPVGLKGPNGRVKQLRMAHSVEAWGYRLGEKKNKDFDPGDWQTWSEEMQVYMLQDIVSMEPLFKYLMSQKPTTAAMNIEHGFAEIIRRQEVWGFTFDYEKCLKLAAKLTETLARLERELVDTFGEWWEGGNIVRPKASRKVKLVGYPDVVLPRYNAAGKRLPKDYVGPPQCHYEAGAPYTPIERVEFSPGSRAHVHKMLVQRYGWKPSRFTDVTRKTPVLDDEVLRALPYPEAPLLADYYAAMKVSGYVQTGKQAWLSVAFEEDDSYRMHGSVMTIGTYTFRASHYSPNMGQIPTRNPEYGHLCRELFTARYGFTLVGFDGSAMQLRLLAHYLTKWDGGTYAGVFERGEDPHAFMRDSIGVDLMGEGDDGRGKGKTLNYALTFGGGTKKLGSIIEPHATDKRKNELGETVKERMLPVFGTAFDDLKETLKTQVERKGFIVGFDGRKAIIPKPHAALATLLQMGEGVVMKKALIVLDRALQAEGLRCGVGPDGYVRDLRNVDYEFCANVHDEAQADVREGALPVYRRHALECVRDAGLQLGVKCPLKSDVKSGPDWTHTH